MLALATGCLIGVAGMQTLRAQQKPHPVAYVISEIEPTNPDVVPFGLALRRQFPTHGSASGLSKAA